MVILVNLSPLLLIHQCTSPALPATPVFIFHLLLIIYLLHVLFLLYLLYLLNLLYLLYLLHWLYLL